MKIEFDDKSYIECRKSENPDKIIITVSAKDKDNLRKRIINAVEISKEDFTKLISDV